MSVTSKIPQNRPSRLAAPSKLPSRILRPTFTNKSQSAVPNFVTSAKQVEKKKETLAAQISDVDSNLNIKTVAVELEKTVTTVKITAKNTTPSVDCNGNKRLQETKEIQENQTEQQSPKGNSRTTKMFSPKAVTKYSDHSTTVIRNEGSYYKQLSEASQVTQEAEKQRSSTTDSSPSRGTGTGTDSRNFRSMKPGYFLQKVNAIKSSHQKAFSERANPQPTLGTRQQQPSSTATKLTLPSRTALYLNRAPLSAKGTFGFKSEDVEQKCSPAVETSTASAVLRPPTQTGRSRLAVKSTVPQTATEPTSLLNKPGTYVSRAEKRKKYLEAKNAQKNSQADEKVDKTGLSLPLPSENAAKTGLRPENAFSQITGSETSIRRPYFRKQAPRSAKIARPVARPKKTPSPVTLAPVPYPFRDNKEPAASTTEPSNLVVSAESKKAAEEPRVPESKSFSVTRTISHVEAPGKKEESQEKLVDADHHSVASVALSEESGYSSVTSIVHGNGKSEDFGKDAPSPPSGFVPGWRVKGRPYRSENDSQGPRKALEFEKERKPHSLSLSDVQSANGVEADRRNLEHQRYCSYLANKNLITFGQYRVQMEGNYAIEHRFGVTEGSKIRTSLGHEEEDLLFHQKSTATPSPDGENENASDSSAETVIPNTRSPQTVGDTDAADHKGQKVSVVPHDPAKEIVGKDLCENETDENHLDDVFHTKQIDGVKEARPAQRDSYPFLSASDETAFLTAMKSPEPSLAHSVTPSSNSAHKSKKRKTDSILMSPLVPDGEAENKVGKEMSDNPASPILERKVVSVSVDDSTRANMIRTSSLDDSANEGSLSELIDLPSLHESALMTDYNSLLEDDLSSEADSDQEEEKKTLDEELKGETEVEDSPSIQTSVINKLLSKGVNGIVRPEEDATSPTEAQHNEGDEVHADHSLMNGYHSSDVSHGHGHHHDIRMEEVFQECSVLKMALAKVYRLLEADEEKMEKQVEENKRLQMKNQKLAQLVESLTHQLDELKVTSTKQSSHKETQIEIVLTDGSMNTEPNAASSDEALTNHSQDAGAQAEAPTRWYHTEVSNEVQSNIQEASEEIKYLKDLRGDFDKRINDAERRLQSALDLMHR